MTWSARLARIGGTELRVHIAFFLMAIYAVLIFKAASVEQSLFLLFWVFSFLGFTIVHELGHLLVARLVRLPVRSSVIWPIGGVHILDAEPRRPLHQILFALGGPAINGALGGLFELLGMTTTFGPAYWGANVTQLSYTTIVHTLMQINYVLAIFNLLPAFPLDGGRLLHGLLSWPLGRQRAGAVTLIVGWLVGLGILIYALYWLNFFLLLLGIMALVTAGLASPEFRLQRRLIPAYMFDRGYYYFLQEDYERAIARYTLEIERGEVKASSYYNRGLANYLLQQYDVAIADFDAALKLQPGDVDTLVHRGMSYYAKGDHARAAADYDDAIVLNPGHTLAHNNRGYLFHQAGNLREALTYYNQAIRFQPDFVRAYINRGTLFVERGEIERGIADYTSAATYQPNNLELLLLRARARKKSASRPLALDDLRAALTLSGDPEQRREIAQEIAEISYAPALSVTTALPLPAE